MMLGLSLSAFTSASPLDWWTTLFLVTTVLTSVTGFMFPLSSLTPAVIFGIISIGVLVIALAGLYVFRLGGAWRWIYVVTALIALYLNTFVGVVQAFQKLAFLQPLAPTQSELPFAVAQLILLAIMLWLGYRAVRTFQPAHGGHCSGLLAQVDDCHRMTTSEPR